MAMMCSRLANTMRGERDAALVLHGVADDGERLLAALAVRRDVIGPLVVALVDLLLGTNLSMSMVCVLSISTASSSSGSISTYLPLVSS